MLAAVMMLRGKKSGKVREGSSQRRRSSYERKSGRSSYARRPSRGGGLLYSPAVAPSAFGGGVNHGGGAQNFVSPNVYAPAEAQRAQYSQPAATATGTQYAQYANAGPYAATASAYDTATAVHAYAYNTALMAQQSDAHYTPLTQTGAGNNYAATATHYQRSQYQQ